MTTVVKLHVGRAACRRRTRAKPSSSCPFKGLAPFDVEDGKFFCGRERLVAEMVARLTGAPLMGIVGASGSGKSSALRAGSAGAALPAGVLPGSDRWAQALHAPRRAPAARRSSSRRRHESRGRCVVAVDQFEELFTACRDERRARGVHRRAAWRSRAIRAGAWSCCRVRADFYGRLRGLPGAGALLVAQPRPRRTDAPRGAAARDRAARAARPGFASSRVWSDALIGGRRAASPGPCRCCRRALLELWQHRDGRTLRAERLSSSRGGVARTPWPRLAERAYGRLDRRAATRRAAPLAPPGGRGRRRRGRTPARGSLAELGDADVADVLAVLADERLITIGDGEAEVADEALLREWPRLCDWLREDADARRLHQHLIRAAHDWESAGRDAAELSRGARLAAALEWRAGHDEELNQLEREFLEGEPRRG